MKKESHEKASFAKRLGAYSVAAGAAAIGATALQAEAVIHHYDNGGAGWYDADSDWNQDMISFKMDGTVYLNTADEYLPGGNPKDADTFSFQELDFWWYGVDEKDAMCLNIGANTGFVAGTNDYEGNEWDVGRLGEGYSIGASLDGRVWSDHAVTSTGGLGGWYFYFHGEWPFGGNGYVGLYADDVDGRHYGWAHVNWSTWSNITLVGFAFESTPNVPILAGDTGPEGIPGDFDGDMDVDADDIDLLTAAIRAGSTDAQYDFDGDGVADDDDLVYHINNLVERTDGGVGTLVGDFNLDGVVNATDLALMKASFGGTAGYANGNANSDTVVNATDLALLKVTFGQTAPTGAVPEPATLSLLALGAAGLVASRRRRQ